MFNDERRTLLAHLQFQRESLLRKIDGLTPAQLHWSPVASGTSLLWLLRHAGFAESIWVLDRLARLDIDPDLLCKDLQPHDTFASFDARYRNVWTLVDGVVADNDLDATCRVDDDMNNPDLRWVLAHLCTETARRVAVRRVLADRSADVGSGGVRCDRGARRTRCDGRR